MQSKGVGGTAGLAAHLGVSRWTVSRVLNGQPGVKAQTRERVLRAVKELGFEPDVMARGLRGVSSGLVGVAIRDLEALVLVQKSHQLQGLLRGAGYRGVYELTENDEGLEVAVLKHFMGMRVDGVVLMGPKLGAESALWGVLRERNIGVVAVDPVERLDVPTVKLDRAAAMEEIVGHLAQRGKRRIGSLGIGTDDMYRAEREIGLRRGVAAHGVTWMGDKSERGYSLQMYRYGEALAAGLLAGGEALPEALICLNDRIAIGAMKVFLDAGIQIPEQVAMVGFDDLAESRWTRPGLSSYDQDVEGSMATAMNLLMESLAGKAARHVVHRGRLRERESSAGGQG